MSAQYILCINGNDKIPLSVPVELAQITPLSLHLPQTSLFSERWEIHRYLSKSQVEKLHELALKYKLDLNLVPAHVKKIKLAVFDMDSTLINGEVIDELARLKGVSELVKSITARAMNGEIDFSQSLKERVALLKGLHRHELLQVHHHLPLNPGVEKVAKCLLKAGVHTAIVTGGFTFFAEETRQKLHFNQAHANTLAFDGDLLSGEVKGHIIDGFVKKEIMIKMALELNLDLNEVAAIGDGANDLPMITHAGLGIAYHAKPIVSSQASVALKYTSMTSILDLMGIAHGV
jgi:phosphoserine phosphatase